MPIAWRVDHVARVVIAVASGKVADADLIAYQREAWSEPGVAGYDELLDVTRVQQPEVHRDGLRDAATLAAQMDDTRLSGRFAIVAESDVAYGLARMYQSYRELDRRSVRSVSVFRTMKEALDFLGIDGTLELPEAS